MFVGKVFRIIQNRVALQSEVLGFRVCASDGDVFVISELMSVCVYVISGAEHWFGKDCVWRKEREGEGEREREGGREGERKEGRQEEKRERVRQTERRRERRHRQSVSKSINK